MRVASIVGARPQFIKASVVSKALLGRGIEENLVHTGQHYDDAMSRVFFEELGMALPKVNLSVGSGSHGRQTGRMMIGLEGVLEETRPDAVLVYGDTNSTLAAAVVAAKMGICLAHVEAGLRSFDRRMPEEVNRVLTDAISDLLFCPTGTAVENLKAEGITEGVCLAGDVMKEACELHAERASDLRPLSGLTSHGPSAYALATVHRAANTDDASRLHGILEGLGSLDLPVVLPLHPRTRERLEGHVFPDNVEPCDPVGYLGMLSLVSGAALVLTDSGGLQKEAHWLGIPCVTLRGETEWIETLEGGWNQLAGADPERIREAAGRRPYAARVQFGSVPGISASELIADRLASAPSASGRSTCAS